MTRFQSRTLIWSIIIWWLWFYFIYSILHLWLYLSITGAVTIIVLWLWIWRQQKWLWFIGMIMSIIIAIQIFFTAIPVYTAKPTLDVFNTRQIPFLSCDINNAPATISIDGNAIARPLLCGKGNFPLYVWQDVSWNNTWIVIIGLGFGKSVAIEWPGRWQLTRTHTSWYSFVVTAWISTYYEPLANTTAGNGIQYVIAQNYKTEKQAYIRENFPWVWENAPLLSQLALRKMKIISVFDRSYNDHIKNLQFYLHETK